MTSGRRWACFSKGLVSAACFTAHSPMGVRGVQKGLRLGRNSFPSSFAPLELRPSRSSGSRIVRRLRLPDGVNSISDWLSPCNRHPRLQRRDRHGIAPCSGILGHLKLRVMPCPVKLRLAWAASSPTHVLTLWLRSARASPTLVDQPSLGPCFKSRFACRAPPPVRREFGKTPWRSPRCAASA